MRYEEVIKKLKKKANRKNVEGMARFGIASTNTLGVSIYDLRPMAKEIGKNHRLALRLWKSGIHEAKILASYIDEPAKVTEGQMEDWAADFDSWDVCDQVCELFGKTPYAYKKIVDWSKRKEEFVKRAAFALIAEMAWHDKEANDNQFKRLFPHIIRESTDERNFVKKAVNWALRNIGKRRPGLKKEAINAAKEIQKIDSKSARWIAADALRELNSK
ncbi:DNA alkylation repair protein [Candidatus Woesebacteria bacterium RIFCSPHIGHO2_12_FULL_42_9]|uniref:DNA alkylation repair protein n=2 Tax=Candidatus Woeseibacteriota TaxID=1752722 RepID=A0A1F8AS74_9BACT|nr:MAG: DNA alkylation repair protein [Candidatus Woesebacteria bacterium GWA1_42_12]OGM54602.1 MAG: DNA alkylation repair protein [Candidatus Woesebacteria bacterium RIFCSPHIGHO2_12_FULL_42_9]